MQKTILSALLLFTAFLQAQTKNFIDQPYLETTVRVDTLVVPDEIFLTIMVTEKDTKGKISVEELENKMAAKLSDLGINIDEQLSLSDISSNFKKYLLKQQDIYKDKAFTLKVGDAETAGKVLLGLEQIGISNVEIERTNYTKKEDVLLVLKSRAISKAKRQAEFMTRPLGQKVGPAIHISEFYNRNELDMMSLNEVVVTGYAKKGSQDFKPLKVEFEKLKLYAEVNVKFKIE